MKPAITGEAPMMAELSKLLWQRCRGRQSHQAHHLFKTSSARREKGSTHLAGRDATVTERLGLLRSRLNLCMEKSGLHAQIH